MRSKAVTDQDDVGQIVIDDEIDDRTGRFGMADLLVDALAVTGDVGRKSIVAKEL
jgi:hypothetical protein